MPALRLEKDQIPAVFIYIVFIITSMIAFIRCGKPESALQSLPTPGGPCPEFVTGDITVSPRGIRPRRVHLWIGPEAQTKDGPLVFYWHGTGMSPKDAGFSIGKKNLKEILGMGGMVVAPYPDRRSKPYPWYIANDETREDDLLVADEVVACAIQKVGIDTRRIHVTGMSAGGLVTSDMALRRSDYVASSSPHSGGIWCDRNYSRRSQHGGPPCPRAYPLQGLARSASLIIHGGSSDRAGDLNFEKTSEDFRHLISGNGGFTILCNHGRGHRIPTEAADAVWRFFQDHPWNVTPWPYANGLPRGFPNYCSL